MKSDIFILNSTYKMLDDGTSIQFYGRSAKGNLTKLEVTGFDPFCYVEGLNHRTVGSLRKAGYVKSIVKNQLRNRRGEFFDVHKVTVIHPKDVIEIRKLADKINATVYRGDINFPLNYLFMNELGPRVTGYGDFDGDYTINCKKVEPSETTFRPDFTIMAFDIENYIDKNKHPDKNIICIGVYWEGNKYIFYVNEGVQVDRKGYFGFSREKDMLRAFFDFIIKEDPDIIETYNGEEYDWPKIMERAEELGVVPNIGRDGNNCYIRKNTNKEGEVRHETFIPGRVSFDVWKSVRKYMSLSDETLGGVGKHLGLGGKTDVDSSKIDEHWENNPVEVLEYCIRDTELTYFICDHEKFIDNSIALADVTMLPFDDTKEAKSSRMVDSSLIRAFQEKGYAIPLHHHEETEDSSDDPDAISDKIEGAFVLQPTAGRYNFIGSCDVKSMYPSQIVENNICYTTIADDEVKEMSKVDENQFNIVEWDKEIKNNRGDVVDVVRTKHFFWKKEYREGIIPGIMERLMEFRADLKTKMKKSRKDKDYYDRLQLAVKTGPLNSTYGILTSMFYRFTEKRIGESITAFSREEILHIAKHVEGMSTPNRRFMVVASDTDSVYCDFQASSVKDAVRLLNNVSRDASHGSIILEPEKVYKVWFNHGKKKRYCGRVVWKDGEYLDEPKDDIKGYEIRRRDGCELQKAYLRHTINAILDEEDMDEHFTDVIKQLQMSNFDPDPNLLILSTSVREPMQYKNPGSEWRVKLWDQMKSRGFPVYDGMRVSYVVTGIKPTTQYSVVVDGNILEQPDLKYYRDRIIDTLAGSSNRKTGISVVFGFDRSSFRNGLKKATIEEFLGGNE